WRTQPSALRMHHVEMQAHRTRSGSPGKGRGRQGTREAARRLGGSGPCPGPLFFPYADGGTPARKARAVVPAALAVPHQDLIMASPVPSPTCGHKLSGPEQFSGELFRCKQCASPFRVLVPGAAPPPETLQYVPLPPPELSEPQNVPAAPRLQ